MENEYLVGVFFREAPHIFWLIVGCIQALTAKWPCLNIFPVGLLDNLLLEVWSRIFQRVAVGTISLYIKYSQFLNPIVLKTRELLFV